MNVSAHSLRCTGCGERIAGSEAASNFRCRSCGDLFEVEYPWSATAPKSETAFSPNPSALRHLWNERRTSTLSIDQSGVWRFRDLFPIVPDDKIITLREGNTPLFELPRCAAKLGLNWLLAKHQGMNPTGSFKDTGMTAALSVAASRGFDWVACASTGNTSAAMAAYAARAGLRSMVLIPEGKIAWGKLSQSMDYGSMTVQLRTDFDGCVRVLNEIVQRAPVYLLNSVNPYRLEGQKTPAFEILEQMDWQVPHHIIVPGGNLANCSALGKGFGELKHLGFINRVPKISVIQAEGANPLYLSMQKSGGTELEPVIADTRASAIRIGNPASWKKAVKILAQTGGWVEQVNEQEIALAKAEIGAEGIGCEPASAVTLAGLKKLVAKGHVGREETAVLLLTGHTLKDPQYTIDFHRGQLLNDAEVQAMPEADRSQMASLQQAPLVLDAEVDQVLRTLEAAAGQPA
ncbi:MAG: threonine synthase [Acidobacteriaceae bacterium]|nr:threonine synthase [Acidobacteriaceae bacterium]